jgi:hypothetical protein
MSPSACHLARTNQLVKDRPEPGVSGHIYENRTSYHQTVTSSTRMLGLYIWLNEQRQEVRAPYSPTRVLRIIQFSHHNSLPIQFNYRWGQIKQIRSAMLQRAWSHANKQIADDNRILDVE